jgi:hypothetical protein
MWRMATRLDTAGVDDGKQFVKVMEYECSNLFISLLARTRQRSTFPNIVEHLGSKKVINKNQIHKAQRFG